MKLRSKIAIAVVVGFAVAGSYIGYQYWQAKSDSWQDVAEGRVAKPAEPVVAFRPPAEPQQGAVDVRPQRLPRIPPGTRMGREAPRGYTHLIEVAKPRVAAGDVDDIAQFVKQYADLLLFGLAARVTKYDTAQGPRYSLNEVAMGIMLEVGGERVVVTPDTYEKLGIKLDLIARNIVSRNEKFLNVVQVARTPSMIVFDAEGIIVYQNQHRRMVIRHAVLVSPTTGKLDTLVWLLDSDGRGGYRIAEPQMQLLPPNYQEDRVLHVDGTKFVVQVPTDDAFALLRIPPGQPVPFTQATAGPAASSFRTPEDAVRLEALLRGTIPEQRQ